MNAENLFLGLLLLATSYSIIVTFLFLHRNAVAIALESELEDLRSDSKQLGKFITELQKKESSDEEL